MGVWGSPQTVSGCAQGAAGTVAGNRTEDERVSGTTGNVGQGTVKKRAQIPCSTIPIQYARELEVGERAMEQWSNGAMQDRQSTRNCMQCSVDCPPAAGSIWISSTLGLAGLEVEGHHNQ